MKSGSKIFGKLLVEENIPPAMQQLRNGELRSLVAHCRATPLLERGRNILGMAIIEAATRWLKQGAKNNL